MAGTQWELPPVGIRVLPAAGETLAARTLAEEPSTDLDLLVEAPIYQGVSFCDAVRRAGKGEMLRVLPGSLQVCGWAPVVLGLKRPEGRFEGGLAPRLDFPIAGYFLAPADRFPGQPQVVVVRASPQKLQAMIQALDPERLWAGHENRLDRSAIPLLSSPRPSPRGEFIGAVNRVLATLARSARWQAVTHGLFQSRLITAGFDAVISRTMADMSVCRNSTVIPLLSDRVNTSLFCTGGITWGRNPPDHMTSGWPWADFARLQQQMDPPPEQTSRDHHD